MGVKDELFRALEAAYLKGLPVDPVKHGEEIKLIKLKYNRKMIDDSITEFKAKQRRVGPTSDDHARLGFYQSFLSHVQNHPMIYVPKGGEGTKKNMPQEDRAAAKKRAAIEKYPEASHLLKGNFTQISLGALESALQYFHAHGVLAKTLFIHFNPSKYDPKEYPQLVERLKSGQQEARQPERNRKHFPNKTNKKSME